jgi:RNA polymerase sigma-70 factor (ECF subfamily)
VRAYQHIIKNDNYISLKPWLYRIATNCAYQVYRRKKLLSFISFSQMGRVDMPDNDRTEQKLENIAVNEIMLQISHDRRICMVLHFVEGFKYREIAEILGISEDAVRKRVARGSDDFRRLYNLGGGI